MINLLGPRGPLQRPYDMFWYNHFTYTQLRFAFVDGGSGAALTLARTCTRGEP